MKKKQYFISNIHIITVVFLFVTYLFFPSFYISISQKLFTTIYTHNTESLQKINTETLLLPDMHTKKDGFSPLNVIARPPQTPYDFFITTALSEHESEKEISRYVYNDALVPIGYIEKKYTSVYVVTLFSSPKSREKFSVNEYVSEGVGEGGGSFSMQIPLGIPITVGMPIVHQVTGIPAGTVATMKNLPEKNIQQVIGILHSNPLRIAKVYVKNKTEEKSITPKTIKEAARATEKDTIQD